MDNYGMPKRTARQIIKIAIGTTDDTRTQLTAMLGGWWTIEVLGTIEFHSI